MTFLTRISALLCFSICTAVAAHAEGFLKPSRAAEIKLADGANDVRTGGGVVRIIKAVVGTLTAHSYETYTSFLLPASSAGAWQHVLVDQPDRDFPGFRTEESADSTVQAIAAYGDHGRTLYVVQATKEGISPPDLYLKQTRVTFRVFQFNGNADVARFKQKAMFQSVSVYTNANDALVREFFGK